MASSDNLATIDPWMYASTIGHPWISSDAFAFARQTDTALTKALHHSLSNHPPQSYLHPTTYCITPTGSGSDPDTPGSKTRSGKLGVKMARRKSGALKRTMTTFIQADPSNFMDMVQRLTGRVEFGNGQLPVSTVVKPETFRRPFVDTKLPTLDTSAYLLEQQTASDGGGDAGLDFDSNFSTFPTLESWN